MYIYVYMFVLYVCVYTHIYVYIYIHVILKRNDFREVHVETIIASVLIKCELFSFQSSLHQV